MTSKRSSGFTLIELLVALVLMSLISLALFGSLGFGARVWERGQQAVDEMDQVEAAQGLLLRLLSQAFIDFGARTPEGEQPIYLVGDEQELTFVSLLPSHLGIGGLYRFRLWLEPGQDGTDDLMIEWRPFRLEESEVFVEMAEERPPLVLIERLDGLSFQFFGIRGQDDEADWDGEWEEPFRLPALVSIEASFPDGDRRHWPPLLVHPVMYYGE